MSYIGRAILGIVLAIAGVGGVGLGAWLIVQGRLPTWMKGIWRWPLGDNLNRTVVRALGWANVAASAACVPGILLLILWNRSSSELLAAMAAMFLAGAATFGAVWSVVLSRSKSA